MPQVELPAELFQQITHNIPTGGSVDDFVREAVERKLADDQCRKEFFRLSDQMRAAMLEQGLTEEELLADFDALRHST
jgi:hypothetical protein